MVTYRSIYEWLSYRVIDQDFCKNAQHNYNSVIGVTYVELLISIIVVQFKNLLGHFTVETQFSLFQFETSQNFLP